MYVSSGLDIFSSEDSNVVHYSKLVQIKNKFVWIFCLFVFYWTFSVISAILHIFLSPGKRQKKKKKKISTQLFTGFIASSIVQKLSIDCKRVFFNMDRGFNIIIHK